MLNISNQNINTILSFLKIQVVLEVARRGGVLYGFREIKVLEHLWGSGKMTNNETKAYGLLLQDILLAKEF